MPRKCGRDRPPTSPTERHVQVNSSLNLDSRVQQGRVHRSVYVDPAIFEAEMELIFERGWVFVGHESEVPAAGDFKAVQIGRQPALLTRHTDGALHVVLNRCMHRGALLTREQSGNTRAFRCLYHGWTFSTNGDLLVVPFAEGYGEGFDQGSLGLIHAARVDSHRGFVFASLSAAVPELRTALGPAAGIIDTIMDAAPEGAIKANGGVQKYTYNANWKLQAENWVDGYHPTFTHQSAFAIVGKKTGAKPGSNQGSAARAVGLPNGHALLDYTGTSRAALNSEKDAAGYRAALEARLGADRAGKVLESDLQILLFPNLFIQSNAQHFRVLRPIAVDKTEVYAFPYRLCGAPDEINDRMTTKLGWWASAAGFGQPDDLEAFERCQEGLKVSQAEWLLFSRGLQREQTMGDGRVVGDITDEVTHRGIYLEWARRMARAND
ncbi:MAG: (2Fe-2S)-binding protein [Ramlibacter sp.]|nr:(2Fe-2S)-binding protein [Ramlibacter sp.]